MSQRYSLTKPFNKDGSSTFYWDVLKDAKNGKTYNRNQIDRIGKYMTFQALVSAGLLKNINGQYTLTKKGNEYIEFYEFTPHSKISFLNEYVAIEKYVKGSIVISDTQKLPVIPVDVINLDLLEIPSVNREYKVKVTPSNGVEFELLFDDEFIADVTALSINNSNNATAVVL